jgi:hypothetical protein
MRLVMLAEQLVGEARVRRAQPMPRHEAIVRGVSAVAFLAVAAVLANTLQSERDFDLLVVLGLVAGHALVSRVRFEFGDLYVVPEQLVFVAMVAIAPSGTGTARSPRSATAGSRSAPSWSSRPSRQRPPPWA